MNKMVVSLLMVSLFCFTFPAFSDAMMRVPSASKAKERELIQIQMKKGAVVTVIMEGYPEFIYPKAVRYIRDDGSVVFKQQCTIWVGKRLADHLVKHGYADYI